MAGGTDVGQILKIALIAGGGFWLYRQWQSGELFPQMAAAPTGADGKTDLDRAIAAELNKPWPPVEPKWPEPSAGAAAQLVADLKTAATGNTLFQDGKGTWDYWNFYRNQLRPPELTGTQAGVAKTGIANDDFMTAEQFVETLTKAKIGVSGLGAVSIALPLMVNMDGRRALVWAGVR